MAGIGYMRVSLVWEPAWNCTGGRGLIGTYPENGVLYWFMRQVFSSSNSVEAGLVKDRLEAAGIACEIRNEAVSQALIGTPFEPEVWILNDEDYADARRIIAGQ